MPADVLCTRRGQSQAESDRSTSTNGPTRRRTDTRLPAVPSTSSRYFPPSPTRVPPLDRSFKLFYNEFIAAMLTLYHAKPILIQEHVSASPWKVLIAVTLLNKTAATKSVPVFFDLVRTWPTPEALAYAPLSQLSEMLSILGLGHSRSQRLVDISHTFLSDPPDAQIPRPSRGHTTALFLSPEGAVIEKKVRYPPTPISHIPGCGPYALDSYRIFCGPKDEWKAVRPSDKELRRYLQWRWATEAYRKWDPVLGPGESIDLEYVRALAVDMEASDPARRSNPH